MANLIYPLAKQGFVNADIDWSTAVVKVAGVHGYTVDTAAEFVSDVTTAGGTLITVSTALANKGSALGVADADNVDFGDVPDFGDYITSLQIFQASAVTGGVDVDPTLQRLIVNIDTGTMLPIFPNGGNLSVAWSELATAIFAL